MKKVVDKASVRGLIETKYGIIVGFVPERWQINTKPAHAGDKSIYDYKSCCVKEANWEGYGEFENLWPNDPYWSLGYRSARQVRCLACGCEIIAHEYTGERGIDQPTPDPDSIGWIAYKLSVEWFFGEGEK